MSSSESLGATGGEPLDTPAMLKERIREQRNRLGLTQVQLGERCGVTGAAVSQWESGTTAPDDIQAVAGALEVSVAFLLNENDVTAKNDPPRVTLHDLDRDVRVLGVTVGGASGDFEMNGDTVDWVRRPLGLRGSKAAFALYVASDSMSPWREPGELVYCNPAKTARALDYVVIQLRAPAGEPKPALLKRFVRKTGKELVVRQYNPAKEFSIPLRDVDQIFRVTPWEEALGV